MHSVLYIGGSSGFGVTPDVNNWPWNWCQDIVAWPTWNPHVGFVNNYAFGDGHVTGITQSSFVFMPSAEVQRFVGYNPQTP